MIYADKKPVYAVGARNIELCDGARGGRRLSVRLWYPAPADARGEPAPVFHDPGTPAVLGQTQGFSQSERLNGLHGQAVWQAPAQQGVFPLLLFSHGYSLFNTQNTIQCEALAGQGYVIAAAAHTGDCIEAAFSDATLRLNPDRYRQSLAESEVFLRRYGTADIYSVGADCLKEWFAGSIQNRYCDTWRDDVIFVLDGLHRLDQSGWFLTGCVDFSRTGIFGMSFGGSTAFYTPHFDSRFKACVNLDGALFGGQAGLPPLPIPALLCGQRADLLRDSGLPPHSRTACILFPCAEHGDFTNLPLWAEMRGVPITGSTGPVDNSRMQRCLTALLIDFFDTHLRGKGSALDDIAIVFSREMRILS